MHERKNLAVGSALALSCTGLRPLSILPRLTDQSAQLLDVAAGKLLDPLPQPFVIADKRIAPLLGPMENLSVLRCLSVFDAQRGTNRVQCLGVQPAH